MSDNTALNVLTRVLEEQSGLVNMSLVEAVYAVAIKHQYDTNTDSTRDAIRTLVSDYVSTTLKHEGGRE